MNLSPFEHHFIRTYRVTFGSNSDKKFLIAVSGGADSMACLLLFKQFQPMFGYEFRVAHVHHGESSSKQTCDFRLKALNLVKDFCSRHQIGFVSNEETLGSQVNEDQIDDKRNEQQLRDFRYSYFEKWVTQGEILVLGHQLEDRLETQMMDLLRGSHFHHWKNLKAYSSGKFRPLSEVKRQDVEEYLISRKQDYISDPSNEDLTITRTWLRHKFFKDL